MKGRQVWVEFYSPDYTTVCVFNIFRKFNVGFILNVQQWLWSAIMAGCWNSLKKYFAMFSKMFLAFSNQIMIVCRDKNLLLLTYTKWLALRSVYSVEAVFEYPCLKNCVWHRTFMLLHLHDHILFYNTSCLISTHHFCYH